MANMPGGWRAGIKIASGRVSVTADVDRSYAAIDKHVENAFAAAISIYAAFSISPVLRRYTKSAIAAPSGGSAAPRLVARAALTGRAAGQPMVR